MALIIFFLIISTIYSLWYIINSNTNDLCSMFYAVALSYIAAFIFYLLQVYFPDKKKVKTIKKIIKNRVNNIIIKIDELYTEMFKLYIPEYTKDIDLEPYMKNLLKFNFNDKTTIGDIRKVHIMNIDKQHFYKTLKQLTEEFVIVFKENIDFLYKAFPGYMPEDLFDALERMRNSLFMQIMPFHLLSPINVDFLNIEPNIFEDFWKLKNELKKHNERIV